MRIGVIGYGYWGPNLVRNFAEIDGVEVRWGADTRSDRQALAKRRYPLLNATAEPHDIFKDSAIDAGFVPTPVFTHYPVFRQALQGRTYVPCGEPHARTAYGGDEP